jgi:hypothetical protein
MASSDVYTTATQGAVLALARAPKWTAVTPSSDAPSLASSGVALEESVRVLVHCALRREAHHRQARLTIPTWVDGAVFTISINGGAGVGHDSSGDADRADSIEQLVDIINADSSVNTIIEASAIAASGSGAVDTIVINGLDEADFGIDFTGDGGSAVACAVDACTAEARLWWTPAARAGSTAPVQWASSGDMVDVDRRGWIERYDCAGLSRLYVQLSSVAGHPMDGSAVTLRTPDLAIGPCLLEL